MRLFLLLPSEGPCLYEVFLPINTKIPFRYHLLSIIVQVSLRFCVIANSKCNSIFWRRISSEFYNVYLHGSLLSRMRENDSWFLHYSIMWHKRTHYKGYLKILTGHMKVTLVCWICWSQDRTTALCLVIAVKLICFFSSANMWLLMIHI